MRARMRMKAVVRARKGMGWLGFRLGLLGLKIIAVGARGI